MATENTNFVTKHDRFNDVPTCAWMSWFKYIYN